MSNICRLCLQISQSTEFFNVFQNTDQHQYPDFPTLADLLYWVFGITIYVDDSYSKLICKECINVIQYVQAFRNIFAANQQILTRQNISVKYKLSKEQHKILTKTPHYTRTACIPFLELVKLEDQNYLEDSSNRYTDIKKISNLSNTSKITTEDETEVCSSSISLPYVEIPRLETFVHRKYKKIDHFTYKKKSVSNEQKCSKRKQKFIEYYYRKSTTALQDLIADRKTKTATDKGISSRSSTSLLEVKNVVDIQMCKICDQVFEKKMLLDMHQEIMHKNSFKHEKNIKRKLKIWKTARNKKYLDKLNSTRSFSPFSSTVAVNSNKSKIQGDGYKNIIFTEQARPLISKALDDMRIVKSSDKKIFSTNDTQLNNQSNSFVINERKMEITNSIPNIPNEIKTKIESNHNLQLKKVNEMEGVGIDEEKTINSVIINDRNEFAKLNQNIKSFPMCNNTRKFEGIIIDDTERKMDNHYSDHKHNSISDKRELKTNITSKNIQVMYPEKNEFCNIPDTIPKQNNRILNLTFGNLTKCPAEKRNVINTEITDFLQEKRVAIKKTRTEIGIMKILRTALEKNITDSFEFLENLDNYEIVNYF